MASSCKDKEFDTIDTVFIAGVLIGFALAVWLNKNSRILAKRHRPPANYTVEIESYEKLFKSEASPERFEFGLFDAGIYKWRLVFYPYGNSADDGAGHISLYLKIDDCSNFPNNWSTRVNYKFFLQDRKNNTFFTLPDAEERRFDKNKKEWGIGKFISLQNFNDPSNGFLINDSCVFGAEVFVIETTGKGETINVDKIPPEITQTWKIKKFSQLDGTESDEYSVGDRKWKLKLYPKGTPEGNEEFLAISLVLQDCKGPPVYADFELRLVDQGRKKNCKQKYSNWFCSQSNSYCDSEFIELEKLHNDYYGYLVGDTLIIELQFLSISGVRCYG